MFSGSRFVLSHELVVTSQEPASQEDFPGSLKKLKCVYKGPPLLSLERLRLENRIIELYEGLVFLKLVHWEYSFSLLIVDMHPMLCFGSSDSVKYIITL